MSPKGKIGAVIGLCFVILGVAVILGLPSGGYVLKHPPMEARTIYSVEALQFCKADGTKLNPQTTKPQNFSIFCDTPAGPATGSWYGKLK